MKKIYLIIEEPGGVYCAAESLEVAEKIIVMDVEAGDLEPGAIIETVSLFSEVPSPVS